MSMNTTEITFITSNNGKFLEFKKFIPQIKHLKIDLPEVQSLDPEVIIEHKLSTAKKHTSGTILIEDTSLYLDALNGFPGPLIKWLTQSVGNTGVYDLVSKIGDSRATARTIIGLCDETGTHYFEGECKGKIVPPVSMAGEGFGWDEIFQPDGLSETFAEMGSEYKNEFSMRSEAIKKLLEYLASK